MANPVLIRELRGRWRRPLTFLTLLFYASILALLMRQVYAGSAIIQHGDLISNARELGRRLFGGFLWMQTAVWMILSPSLTATSISSERERGLLEGVLLSPVTAGQIVRGKIGSAMWFIVLLLLVPMPIAALCFTLGGLSPEEFALAYLLLGATAISGASLGLATSACHQRSDSALMTALLITISLSWPPVLVAFLFHTPDFKLAVAFCVIYQMMLASSALGVASDAVNKLIPEREVENAILSVAAQQEVQKAKRLVESPPWIADQVGSALLEGSQIQASTLSERDASEPRLQTGYQELAWANRLHFANPVMHREVQARLRRRMEYVALTNTESTERRFVVSTSPLDWVLGGAGAMLLISVPAIMSGAGVMLAVLWLAFVVLVAATFGALSFTREREGRTLQPLLMTALLPREVVWGKAGATCVLAAVYGVPFLPVVLLALAARPWLLLATLILTASGAWLATAISLYVSWDCRKTAVAVAGAMTCVFFSALPLAVLPILLVTQQVAIIGSTNSPLIPKVDFQCFQAALWLGFGLCAAGSVLLKLLQWRMRPSALSKENTSIWSRNLSKDL